MLSYRKPVYFYMNVPPPPLFLFFASRNGCVDAKFKAVSECFLNYFIQHLRVIKYTMWQTESCLQMGIGVDVASVITVCSFMPVVFSAEIIVAACRHGFDKQIFFMWSSLGGWKPVFLAAGNSVNIRSKRK